VLKPGCSKRVFDVVVSAIGLVVLAPVLAALAVAVRLSSRGPVLHRARRVGRGGGLFTLYKFRSMRIDAGDGPGVTAAGDARITRLGRLMRATKLDELPQLLNVLRGDMSIVGPRPEDPRYVAWYTPEQRGVLAWRPGITSPASIAFRNEESLLAGSVDLEARYREVMGRKIAADLAYFPNATVASDLTLIARTVRAVLRPSVGGAANG
jgi:lipopolysaccharide/colanic/teichoic acid biosynthesis glycosyltransferase